MGYLGMVPSLTPLVAQRLELNQFQAMFVASISASLVAITLSQSFDTMKTNLQGDLGRGD